MFAPVADTVHPITTGNAATATTSSSTATASTATSSATASAAVHSATTSHATHATITIAVLRAAQSPEKINPINQRLPLKPKIPYLLRSRSLSRSRSSELELEPPRFSDTDSFRRRSWFERWSVSRSVRLRFSFGDRRESVRETRVLPSILAKRNRVDIT